MRDGVGCSVSHEVCQLCDNLTKMNNPSARNNASRLSLRVMMSLVMIANDHIKCLPYLQMQALVEVVMIPDLANIVMEYENPWPARYGQCIEQMQRMFTYLAENPTLTQRRLMSQLPYEDGDDGDGDDDDDDDDDDEWATSQRGELYKEFLKCVWQYMVRTKYGKKRTHETDLQSCAKRSRRDHTGQYRCHCDTMREYEYEDEEEEEEEDEDD